MPPHEPALTSCLLETLQESRIKLRDYVDMRKKQIDDEVAQYNQILNEEQTDLDDKTKKLDKMKSERSSEEGIAQRRLDLDQDEKELERTHCKLKKEQHEQEQTLERKCSFSFFQSTVLLYHRSLVSPCCLLRSPRRRTSYASQS